jgi:hypothetical protein
MQTQSTNGLHAPTDREALAACYSPTRAILYMTPYYREVTEDRGFGHAFGYQSDIAGWREVLLADGETWMEESEWAAAYPEEVSA